MQKLIILIIICALCGTCGVVKSSVTVYEVMENKNLTIRWNTHMTSDVTLMNMMCEFHSDHVKVLYEMIRGDPVAADEQFAGRVQFDRNAPKEAEIRLHLSRVTAQDAGSYVCYLVGNYDQSAMRWRLEMCERFLLNVTSGAERRPDCPTTADREPGGATSGSEHRALNVVLSAAGAGALTVLMFYLVYRVIKNHSCKSAPSDT